MRTHFPDLPVEVLDLRDGRRAGVFGVAMEPTDANITQLAVEVQYPFGDVKYVVCRVGMGRAREMFKRAGAICANGSLVRIAADLETGK